MPADPSLINDIRAASRTMVREWGFMGATLGGTGYSPSVVHTLVEIEARGTMTAAQLVHVLNLEKSSVSRLVGKLVKDGLLEETVAGDDGRVKQLSLTEKGRETVGELNDYGNNQVSDALDKLTPSQRQAVAEGLAAYARALKMCRLGSTDPHQGIEIVPFEPQYQQAFKALNEEWISRWFKMEAADYKALDHPQEYILDRGGFVFIVLSDGEPIGTCALIKVDETTYELAKMTVSDKAKGKGIGFLLGQTVIEQAKRVGAKRLYLESNTQLQPAIGLYRKLGFQEVHNFTSPYERCDIQMDLLLD